MRPRERSEAAMSRRVGGGGGEQGWKVRRRGAFTLREQMANNGGGTIFQAKSLRVSFLSLCQLIIYGSASNSLLKA
jgi:hypothetical protein